MSQDNIFQPPGNAAPGAASGGSTPAGGAPSGSTPDGAAQHSMTPDGPAEHSVTPDGAAQHSVTPDGAAQHSTAPVGGAQAGGAPAAPPASTGSHWWAPSPPDGSPDAPRPAAAPSTGAVAASPAPSATPRHAYGASPYGTTGQYPGSPVSSWAGTDRPTGPSYPYTGSQGAVPPRQSWTQAGSAPGAGPATAIGAPLFGERGYPTGSAPAPGGVSQATAVKPRRRGTLIAASTVALALLAGFGGGALAAGLNDNSTTPVASALTTTGTSPTVSSVTPAPSGSVQQVADAILPSVVSVLSSSSSGEGEGSGIILSADGQILTNNHVIDGATDLQVQFNDGSTAKATVVGADPVDDLAVIKAEGKSGLTPATLGTSADLQVGQDVVAVGSPLGLSATVTSGIVSALNRPVATSNAQDQQQQQQQLPGFGQQQLPGQGQQDQSQAAPTASQSTVINAIQTDAAINPGNSGGPLVDMSGKVIGVNSAIASLSSGASGESGSIGVGFAIPIDQAKRIAEEIIKTGKATHAVLGASVGDATVNGQALLTSGAKISQLTAGGGAEKAGLQVGDVITKVGEQRVESADALVAAIRSAAPNGTVKITYTRDSDTKTVTVTLGSSST
jgi:putative serine protease PepD